MPDERLRNLDMLRGVAILLVVVVHCGQKVRPLPTWLDVTTSMGQLGVQLFFVLSAYTLMLSWNSAKTQSYKAFFVRRFFRIAPLYYIGICIYGLRFYTQNLVDARAVLANVALAHGLYPPGNNSVVPGGWSIGCEFLFYLIFPFLAARTPARRQAGNWILVSFLAGLFLWALIALLAGRPLLVDNDTFQYYCLPTQFPVFLFGIYAYAASHEEAGSQASLLPWVGLAALALILTWTLAPFGGLTFYWIPSLAGWLFSLCLVAACRTDSTVSTQHSAVSTLLSKFGLVSYSVYIFHFAVLECMFVAVQTAILHFHILPNVYSVKFTIILCGTTTISYWVGIASHRWIEEPGMRLSKRLLSRNGSTKPVHPR